jgi:hypothetical protein
VYPVRLSALLRSGAANTQNSSRATGPVAEAFTTGAAAAQYTRLGNELAELNALRAAQAATKRSSSPSTRP